MDHATEQELTTQAGAVAVGLAGHAAQEARTLALLSEISRELTAILDREELLRRIAQRVKRLIDYQLFSVMLWNDERQVLAHAFSLRFGEEIQVKTVLRRGEGLCGTAMLERRPVRVANVHTDSRYVQCSFGMGVRSELVAPLIFKDRVIGVLDLESTSYDAFTEEHGQILSTLASSIAIALENARLYEEVRRSEQRLEKELAMAREVQRQLLPPAAPQVEGVELGIGYLPARQLGGDFYDFPAYSDGRLAVAVGDVAGKGTAAALYASLAIGILREHVAGHACPPAEMLEHLNRRLHQPRMEGRFVAMALGVYDPRSRALALANAGFPRPVLVRRGRAEAVAVAGVPLGLLPGTQYEEKKLVLEPGDLVVFCSDGIHECMDAREEEFGLKRVGEILAAAAARPAPEIAQQILRATDGHAATNGGPGDDRTVVVLKLA